MPPSPIEKAFAEACRSAGLKVEAEKMVGRYRPDFIIREQRLAIELDGHDTHASVEDRTNDVVRQRYLERLGWTVLRFTGSEVYRDAAACVAEVQDLLRARACADPDSAIYVDWLFFQRAAMDFTARNRGKGNPELIGRDSFLLLLSNYLDLPSVVAVHLFGAASTFSKSASVLETSRTVQRDGRTLLIEEHQADFAAIELLDHLDAHRSTYAERVVLVADDGAYPPGLMPGMPGVAAIIRLDNAQSRMLPIGPTKWQDIDYLFAHLVGMPPHEIS